MKTKTTTTYVMNLRTGQLIPEAGARVRIAKEATTKVYRSAPPVEDLEPHEQPVTRSLRALEKKR